MPLQSVNALGQVASRCMWACDVPRPADSVCFCNAAVGQLHRQLRCWKVASAVSTCYVCIVYQCAALGDALHAHRPPASVITCAAVQAALTAFAAAHWPDAPVRLRRLLCEACALLGITTPLHPGAEQASEEPTPRQLAIRRNMVAPRREPVRQLQSQPTAAAVAV